MQPRAHEITLAIEADPETAGIGLSGSWNGRKVSLGRSDQADAVSTTLRIEGRGDILIPMTDQLRPDTPAALARLGRWTSKCRCCRVITPQPLPMSRARLACPRGRRLARPTSAMRLPRYTSFPTAAEFGPGVRATDLAQPISSG